MAGNGDAITGECRDRVVFQRRQQLDPSGPGDGAGNYLGDWAPLGARAVQLNPVTGGEEAIAARAQGFILFDMMVRSDALTRSLVVGDRAVDFRDPDRQFNIRKGPMDLTGRRRWLYAQLELGLAT